MDIPYNELDLPNRIANEVMKTSTIYVPTLTFDVRFKRVHPDAIVPEYHTRGAAGFDLSCVEDITLCDDSPIYAPTGLVIATPEDHMLLITHRSSTPRKWGVTVMNGIVDEDYCGDKDELKLQVRRIRPNSMVHISAGTRIAQGIFVPVSRGKFIEVDEMGDSRGGWGSTG